MTVLEELADYAKERTRQAKRKISPEQMRGRALELPKGIFAFEKALKKPELKRHMINGEEHFCACHLYDQTPAGGSDD